MLPACFGLFILLTCDSLTNGARLHEERKREKERERIQEPEIKASFNLPTTSEARKLADSYFQTSLVPSVLAVYFPEEMNKVLCEGIYLYFSSSLAPSPPPPTKKKKRPPHSLCRTLREGSEKQRMSGGKQS